MSWDRLFSATMRHMVNFWQKGEIIDQDSGCYNLACAICDLLMLLSYQLRGIGRDNRPVKGMGKNE